GRTMQETLSHLYNMVDFAGRTLEGKVTEFPEKPITWPSTQLRAKTLSRISELVQLCLGQDSGKLHAQNVNVKVGGGDHEFPFWHFFNGPLVDAFWHLGQVASFRRSLGKPMDSKVEPFLGIRRDV
ncbi:MAG: hypothetical protein KTR24_04280, partial [Saprospiraceae bacterium]|nr:hypothetical protein [Saprospiraceae bacterium]